MFSSLTFKLSILTAVSIALVQLLVESTGQSSRAGMTLACLTAMLVSSVFIKRHVINPLNKLIESMRLLEQGNSNAKVSFYGSSQMQELSFNYNIMVDRVMELLDRTASHVFELAQAQERLEHNIELSKLNKELETTLAEVRQLNIRQESVYLSTLNALVTTIEASDPYTHGHSHRMTNYSLALASRIGLTTERTKILEQAGILHDIGKIGIDKSILHKPGRLTDEEYASMKQHPVIATNILHHIHNLAEVQDCVVKHHERFDGKGYPFGISGDEIPIEARILTIADAFDAITSHRPYRKGMPIDFAIKELYSNSGTQFDPELVEQFVGMLRDGALPDVSETSLPNQSEDTPEDMMAKLKQARPLISINVLLVEDDPFSSVVVRKYFEKMGHTVDEAATADEGIKLFAEKRYDLALVDIGLPDYDGYTVARGMRQIEKITGRHLTLRTVICALTSCSEEEAGAKALSSGMNVFIQKPFNAAAMVDIIDMACQVAERNSLMNE